MVPPVVMTERQNKLKRITVIFSIIMIGITWTSVSDAYEIKKIIGFGDSITSGRPYSDLIGGGRQGYGGYEPVLEQLFSDSRRTVHTYNWGWGGETTPTGINRIDSVLRKQESSFVLIMEGTNDQWLGVSARTTAANLGFMIDKCRAADRIPLLGNLTPADRDTGRQIPRIYNPAIADVAEQKKVILVDHYSAVADRWNNLKDPANGGVHPNREGYRVIAGTWHDALLSLIMPPFYLGTINTLLLSE